MIMISRDDKTAIVSITTINHARQYFNSFGQSAHPMGERCTEALHIMETASIRTVTNWKNETEWVEYNKADWKQVMEAGSYVEDVCAAWYNHAIEDSTGISGGCGETEQSLYGNGPDIHFTDSTMDDASDLYGLVSGTQMNLPDEDYYWMNEHEFENYLIQW
jgi:hypothetical protein